MNSNDREESLTLEILQTIEQKNDVTQRHLADRLDIALGLANSYLKRLVRKGLVKIHQAPANRYLYYLTPKGFAEKSRLTATYLSSSFDFYRRASESLSKCYKECSAAGDKRILFCGISELAEIAYIRSQEHPIEVIGTYDSFSDLKQYMRHPVWKKIEETDEFDRCLITSLTNLQVYIDQFTDKVNKEKILIPSILGLNTE